MGKISWSTSADEIDSYEDDGSHGGYYDGPVPPPSIYRAKVAEVKFKTFQSGNSGIRVTLDIDDPRADKKQYTGARMWENVVDLENSTFKIKQFLDAIGATGKDWANTVKDNDDIVTKIGKIKTNGDSLYVRVQTKYGKYEGAQRAEVARFLPKASESTSNDSADDASGSDDDDPPF